MAGDGESPRGFAAPQGTASVSSGLTSLEPVAKGAIPRARARARNAEPSLKTGQHGSSSERLADREFTLRDIRRKPASRRRTLGKPVTCWFHPRNILWNYGTLCTRYGRNRARGRAGARARSDNPFRNSPLASSTINFSKFSLSA